MQSALTASIDTPVILMTITQASGRREDTADVASAGREQAMRV